MIIEPRRLEKIINDFEKSLESFKKAYDEAGIFPLDGHSHYRMGSFFTSCIKGLPIGLLMSTVAATNDVIQEMVNKKLGDCREVNHG